MITINIHDLTKRHDSRSSVNRSFRKYGTIGLLFLFISLVYVYINSYYLVSGVDFNFHLYRSAGLIQSLENGDYFPKINYFMANRLGYGVPLFYGQYFLYIPAILVAFFNFSLLKGWLALYVVFYFISMSLLFFTAKKMKLSDTKAIIFPLLLLLNPLMASIINGDLAFAICLVLMPLVLVYLNDMFTNQSGTIIPLAILATIIINTHILSTIIIALICLFFVIINIKKVNIFFVKNIIVALGLTVLLSAFFIFPMVEQMLSQQFIATNTEHAFRVESVQGIGTILVNSLNDSIKSLTLYPTISLIGILLLFCILFFSVKEKMDIFQTSLFKLIGLLIILGSSIFPWSFFSHTPLASVQFIGRYLVFSLVLIIFLAMLYKKFPVSLLLCFLLLTGITGFTNNTLPTLEESTNETYKQKKLNKFNEVNSVTHMITTKQTINGISGGEYLNKSVNPTELPTDSVQTEYAAVESVKKSYGKIEVNYKVSDPAKAKLIVPFFWYKGYVANYSNDGAGTQPKISLDDSQPKNNGLISLSVKKAGKVEISYSWTLLQKVSLGLSLLTLFSLFIFKIVHFRNKN